MKLPPRKIRVFEAKSRLEPQQIDGLWDELDQVGEDGVTRLERPADEESGEAEAEAKESRVVAREPEVPLLEALTAMLGEGKVSAADEVRAEHSKDKWFASHLPEVVVFAESTEDVSKLLAYAHRKRIPVTTRGAGIGYVGGCVPVKGGVLLSMARMNSILAINPKDGVAVTQPGVITGDLQKAVRALGWDYPPDPASLKECSIGGNIATNAGGPRCLKYGVTRNYVIGLEVVLCNGRVMRCGGRTLKNKTGFDLIGLFVGSEGMLGIVTEITLRIIPKPPARGMLAAVFPDFAAAARTVHDILQAGHLPSALEITDAFTLEASRKVHGADVFPPGDGHLIVEIDGRPAAVRAELEELHNLLVASGAGEIRVALNEEECEAIWQMRRGFSYALRDTGLTKLNEDIVVPRSKLVELVEFTQMLQEETGIAIACFGHAGDGNIHANLMVENYEDPDTRVRADATLEILFAWVLLKGGAITGEHGVGLAKKPWIREALGEVSFAVHRSLKRSLDPHNILNPGKFLDD
jgi:glycolate oxidase